MSVGKPGRITDPLADLQAAAVGARRASARIRLVEEFLREAVAAGFACHTGLVLDFGTGTGRDAVRAIVRSLLGPEGSRNGPKDRAGPFCVVRVTSRLLHP